MKHNSTELTELHQTNRFKDFIDKIGKRNLIIACAVLLIGAAVWLNFILFSGTDQGGYGDYDQPSGNISDNLNNGNGNSDTNILVAFDAGTRQINCVSIPRDTLIDVDWGVKKINACYGRGGIKLMAEKLEEMLGIPIDITNSFCVNVLSSQGDTKRITLSGLLSGALNVLGNLFFVIVIPLGVAGVALSTVLPQMPNRTLL